ncbi:HAMP domain-containing sensor histidine kinase [Saccharibacillus sp. O23]|uniref:sensor histidine kinase n=1 Tax=Saccharibacillus sp. O23 TaxID=2009338 RepID=UPI0015C5ADE9|nr:ATP-binding protein [Saccharibacillus sp. O23]
MKYSMQTDLCPSPALAAASEDLFELAAGMTDAETLFVAKQTDNGMRTMLVWGREREGVRAGQPLIYPKDVYCLTVPLPFACDGERGIVGALRASATFGDDEEASLKRAASVAARLAESEQKSAALKRESELQRGREHAEREARRTGELLAVMGHEIRTPMNGIVAMSQLLRESGLTEEQDHYLQIIEDSQKSLLELVSSILDYGKLEARQMKLELAPMDLAGALEDTAYQFAAKAAQRPELELTLDLDLDTVPMLIGDVRKIRQILGNLLSNAIKFTTVGEVRVTARQIEGDAGDRAWIEFCVCDTGIGISQTGIERLFQDYAQVHRPEEGDYGGTGLGLSISKRLVDLMGGKIWAQGNKGQGTRMTFVLPLEIEQGAYGESSPRAGALSGRRLLLAAGGGGTRETLSRLARRMGMEVREASGGAEAALALAREGPFDLVLSEWEIEREALLLPGLPPLPDVPSILLLPLVHDSEAEAGPHSSFASLTKPVRQSEMYEVLASACQGRPIARERRS